MMLPQIPVGIEDPIERLAAIRKEMDTLKASDQGAAFDRLLGLVENAPAAFSALAGRFGVLPGMINLACTNVPGPLIPLYGTGHRMLDFYPMLPLAGDLGLGVAIMSYDQHLHWGISCDPEIVPDVDAIGRLIGEEFVALRDAAGVPATDLPKEIGAHQPPSKEAMVVENGRSRVAASSRPRRPAAKKPDTPVKVKPAAVSGNGQARRAQAPASKPKGTQKRATEPKKARRQVKTAASSR
jgi:hypothetical protein